MAPPILSPITFTKNTIEIGRIESREIIDIYTKHFNMDVSRYFEGLREVRILKCLDTQYVFYYPFTTEGDEAYYQILGQYNWYYNPSRWEHVKAVEQIGKKDFVLEVGAGTGFFLNELKKRNINSVGLELNGKAIEDARKIKISLQKELVQQHAEFNPNKYDVVCSFQVLEHISQPFGFIEAQIKCLKPNGKLIIGVPNNNSYMKDNKMYNKVLNMPPHHMGLWTYDSLKSLENIFDIKLIEVYYEPLIGGNVDVYMWNKVNRFFLGLSFFTKVVWKLRIHEIIRYFLNKKQNKIRGNSMLAVFEKKF
ncbi:MAG: class I SAM-dependent methyltransferase [Bacteroidetes bacterium]|nr:class I SAM-dependent methyltransferase [Bacteroidota bacterium]